MSTKCIIAINNGKSVKAIYCHWDGYPKWTGRILNENYTDTSKINRLIKLGDIDFLGKSIECNPVTKVFGPDWEAHDNAKYKDAIDTLNTHKRGLGTKIDRIFQEELGHAEKYTLAYKRDYKLKNMNITNSSRLMNCLIQQMTSLLVRNSFIFLKKANGMCTTSLKINRTH